jgi:hypothetical protein
MFLRVLSLRRTSTGFAPFAREPLWKPMFGFGQNNPSSGHTQNSGRTLVFLNIVL